MGSVFHWIISHPETVLWVASVLLNEVIAWNPYTKANSILQLIVNILKRLRRDPEYLPPRKDG